MRYVIIRDDDTNALTPVECLERLYRPFLDYGFHVNLATIPDVSIEAKMSDGQPEGFLVFNGREAVLDWITTDPSPPPSSDFGAASRPSPLPKGREGIIDGVSARAGLVLGSSRSCLPIASNQELIRYLVDNPGYHIVQHGCHHEYLEFDHPSRSEIAVLLDTGAGRLVEAGFPAAETFVAPYDRLSRAALLEVSSRFRVLSTGWYELGRLPTAWWPQYVLKKLRDAPHWQVGGTILLSHPGCLLSYKRSYSGMLDAIISNIQSRRLTVLVTHWWEYFRNGHADEPFIAFLHETADYLASNPEIKVISFSELVNGDVPLD